MRLLRTLVATAVAAAAITLVAVQLQSAHAALPSGWTIVTSPTSGSDNVPLGTACANSFECWSVGITIVSFNNNASFTGLIDKWNGTSWAPVASSTPSGGNGYGFFGVTCATSSDCWAVGAVTDGTGGATGPLTENWNGSTWSVVPSPEPSGAAGAILRDVSCTSISDCWAVGDTTAADSDEQNMLIDHWNGTAWTIVPAAPSGQTYDQLDGVTCVSPSDCWAAGVAGPNQQMPNFLPIFPQAVGNQAVIENWNGSTWSIVPSGAPQPSYLASVTCVTASDCWASGSTMDAVGDAGGTLMERWNGSSWSVVSTPDQPGGNLLADVTCLDANSCWAAGSYGTLGGGGGNGFDPQPMIEGWNGSSWSIQPIPDVTALAFLNSVTCLRGTSCWATGSSVTNPNGGNNPGLQSLIEQLVLPPSSNQGIVLTARDGGIFNLGNAPFSGSMAGQPLDEPIVGIAATPDGNGYWEVASDGGVFNFGSATFEGSMGGHPLNKPIVGIAATPDGNGYWEVASDGGVFSFGDAAFYGSMGGQALNKPIVGLVAAPDGAGYWEVASDGGVFNFGSATFEGSLGALTLNRPIVGMAATPDGGGYWEVASDGGVFALGNAGYFGSVPGQGIVDPVPIVGVTRTPDGVGYWLVGADGAVYAFGSAIFLGSLVGIPLAAPVVGVTS